MSAPGDLYVVRQPFLVGKGPDDIVYLPAGTLLVHLHADEHPGLDTYVDGSGARVVASTYYRRADDSRRALVYLQLLAEVPRASR